MSDTKFMVTSVVSGGFAGISCDIILFPIDTVKTRLQSSVGFNKAGGFRNIFRGVGSIALGSIPNAAVFFLAYDVSKYHLPKLIKNETSVYMVSGCIGEVVSCCVRMPFEVVKQTAQAGGNYTSRTALRHIFRTDGIRGLYSGFLSTILRDVPYTVLQMPIWELLKSSVAKYNRRKEATVIESGFCGAAAGGIASALTTPLDVAKTRIILLDRTSPDYSENPLPIIRQIYRREGISKLFAGVTPRVIWISLGGFIYFSAYDFAKSVICDDYLFKS